MKLEIKWTEHRQSIVIDKGVSRGSCCLVSKLCLPLCDLMDCSPLGSSVHGISQARILEWVAISFSKSSSWSRDQAHISWIGRQTLYHWATNKALLIRVKVKLKSLSPVRLFATPQTAAYQAPPSMGFSRHEYWSGVPSPSPSHKSRGYQFWNHFMCILELNIWVNG